MQLSCVEGSCRADLALQQVAPYPCPCVAPDGFLGYGRLVDELSLTREEQVGRLHVVPKWLLGHRVAPALTALLATWC